MKIKIEAKATKILKLSFFHNCRPLPYKLLFCLIWFLFLAHLPASVSLAVTSRITTHTTSRDLLKGKAKDVVISSKGTIQLGRAAEILAEEIEDVWIINSMVISGGNIYIGTSPNGAIYQYTLGKLKKIYPLEPQQDKKEKTENKEPKDTNTPDDANTVDANTVETEQYLTNEHIFAMAADISGRLLAGISGEKCKLIRFNKGKVETVFEPEDAKYIFAIVVAENGDIYLGTGPNGKIYHLNSFAKLPKVVYTTTDKNVLSLAIGKDDLIYAGTDTRGLVYKINTKTAAASVLYDSEQEEITSLLLTEDGHLYAAATSARVKPTDTRFAAPLPLAGRPDAEQKAPESTQKSDGGLKLNIANTKKDDDAKAKRKAALPTKGKRPGKNSFIYKITPAGYVTEVFTQQVVLFTMTAHDNRLFVGTGNNAELFSIDPDAEDHAVVYTDEQASQITAVTTIDRHIYLGTANPAKLIKLTDGFAKEGTYTSDLIDASQPTRWGKLQIEADIPTESKVLMSCRSGNVKDPNDPTYSQWTDPIEVTKPLDLTCPIGRFCQYKLTLKSPDGKKTPVIREIAVADTIPNLPPRVESVTISRLDSAAKAGSFKITYKATDQNADKLTYKIDFRKISRTNWIELKDDIKADSFEWNGKTVEDGRYEIKVTAFDVKSNTTESALTASRISETIVVDNTAPDIKKYSMDVSDGIVTLKLNITDQLSAIKNLHYTVDSSDDWNATIPNDLVYDTTEEDFTIVTEKLETGEHIISVKITDAVGNTVYKTFEVNIAGN